jgi:hypothetical protein
VSAEDWCEVMDMGKAGCAHCRADRARLAALDRELRGETSLGPVFPAGFASKCATCDELIYVGEQARRAPDGWIHATCGYRRSRER